MTDLTITGTYGTLPERVVVCGRTYLPVDDSTLQDAARFRWILNGNGYFMEEERLCGHSPCDQQEQDEARAEIDKAMQYDPDHQHTPQPSLKAQALWRCNDYIDPDGIIRRALEQLPDAPAVTPAADDRGPGSVADIVNATDEELNDLYEDAGGVMSVAFRAIYNLGREHGAEAHAREQEIVRIGEWLRDRAKGGDPAPTADGGVPLWKAMHAAYERVLQEDALESGHFYAAELRAVADWLERMGDGTPWMEASEVFATSLRAEADRAEAGR